MARKSTGPKGRPKRWQGLKIRIRRGPRRRWLLGGLGLFGVILAVLAWQAWPLWQLSAEFARPRQPSRLYEQSTELRVGEAMSPSQVIDVLEHTSYRKADPGAALRSGFYRREGSSLEVLLRTFPTPQGPAGGGLLEVGWRGSRITRLVLGGTEVDSALLEPAVVATYYGPSVEERRPVAFDDLPDHVVRAVLAAEDDRFFKHPGVSLRSILRAMWANLSDGEGPLQGGSTLTQQLVKNLYLTHERTLSRKVPEGVLAIFVELRYSKREILEAYLNEIYLGASGGANLIGFGAASRAYLGKDAEQLDLAEAALLAGIIPSPANYSPSANPEVARSRRNLILNRMQELGWAEPGAVARARDQPLVMAPQKPVRRAAPHFAAAAAAEARRRFGLEELAEAGYSLLSTLSLSDQRAAAESVQWGLPALEEGWEKGAEVAGPLEAALVSLDPRSGAIRAYVGGRDYSASQFDRAGQARRQAGSAFKPVVYAAAFEDGVAAPSSLVEDEPLTVVLASQRWSPRNDSGEFAGWVSVREAVERSLNVPTARVALATGLPRIVEVARGMGVTARLQPLPALALGAFEVTPVELATVYATLAAGGVRPSVHGLEAVLTPDGAPIGSPPLPPPERVLSEESAYLVTSVLEGVVDRGTGSSARIQGLRDRVAGKTGTSNDRRDSWFGGYSPGRVSVIWVGYDDNAATRLSGSRAALPIWARFTHSVRPTNGYPTFPQPRGIVTALVDPASGGLATDRCLQIETEVFRAGEVPREICYLHGGYRSFRVGDGPPREREKKRRLRRWLRKVFGSDDG